MNIDQALGFFKMQSDISEKEEKMYQERHAALPKSNVPVFCTTQEKLRDQDETRLPCPKCPRCGNLDPCAFLDDDTIETIAKMSRENDHMETISLAPKRGTLLSSITTFPGACKFSSGEKLKCHACNTIFLFDSFESPFNDKGTTNCEDVSPAYLARLIVHRNAFSASNWVHTARKVILQLTKDVCKSILKPLLACVTYIGDMRGRIPY